MLTDDCLNCAKPIEFVPSNYSYDWFHIGGDRHCASGNSVAKAPARCPKCKSTNYAFDQTDPWADYSRCGDCGHVDRRSLGD